MAFDFAGGIGGIVGGLLGAGAASGDLNQSRQLADKAYQEILSMGAPPETAQALVLEKFKSAGLMTPELESYIQAGPSQVAGITEDPLLKQKQMSALELLSQRATGGLNPEDRAKYNELREQAAKEQNAKQQQIIQNYQARGMGGSGAEIMAALQGEQSGANQMSQAGDQIAATASQNALQAALQSGQLGGQIRQQDFNVNQAKGSAADEMNRFNVQNRTTQQARNVAAQNQGQMVNLSNNQNLANANTQMANQETARQNQARLNDYNNKFKLAQARAGVYGAQSADFAARGQKTADQGTAIGSIVGQGLGAAMGAFGTPSVSGVGGGGRTGQSLTNNYAHGGLVPGIAKVSGDHPINDTVAAHLSPGEIVLPKSIMESHDPGDLAKKFVNYIQALNKKPEYKYGKDGK